MGKRVFIFLCCALVILNIFDVSMTIIWLATGVAIEANPLMDVALNYYGFFVGALLKSILVLLGVLLLIRFYKNKWAWIGLIITLLVYIP